MSKCELQIIVQFNRVTMHYKFTLIRHDDLVMVDNVSTILSALRRAESLSETIVREFIGRDADSQSPQPACIYALIGLDVGTECRWVDVASELQL